MIADSTTQMNNDIEILEEIFQYDTGSFIVSKATFRNEPCYAVQNFHKGEIRTVVFDNESVMQSVVSRMKRTKMCRDNKSTGSKFMFKFNRGKREPSISLRPFLWSKYKHIPIKQAKELKICLHDMSSTPFGIIDLRERNLYDSSDVSNAEITTLSDGITGRKFIVVQCEGATEFIDYSPELFQLLRTKDFCTNYQKNRRTNRINLAIHYAKRKDGILGQNLSRFVAVYNDCFGRFKNQKGALKRFIRQYPALNKRFERMHGSHVNACKFNHSRENLMFMPDSVNMDMGNYAARIAGKYRMNPFRFCYGESDKILIEWNIGEDSRYIVCNSVEDYADLQGFILGASKYTQNLVMRLATIMDDHETVVSDSVHTPKEEALPRNGVAAGSVEYKDILRMMYQWSADCERVTKLYREQPGLFWNWKNTEKDIATEDLLWQTVFVFGYCGQLTA